MKILREDVDILGNVKNANCIIVQMMKCLVARIALNTMYVTNVLVEVSNMIGNLFVESVGKLGIKDN
jgi:hypothetical protein